MKVFAEGNSQNSRPIGVVRGQNFNSAAAFMIEFHGYQMGGVDKT